MKLQDIICTLVIDHCHHKNTYVVGDKKIDGWEIINNLTNHHVANLRLHETPEYFGHTHDIKVYTDEVDNISAITGLAIAGYDPNVPVISRQLLMKIGARLDIEGFSFEALLCRYRKVPVRQYILIDGKKVSNRTHIGSFIPYVESIPYLYAYNKRHIYKVLPAIPDECLWRRTISKLEKVELNNLPPLIQSELFEDLGYIVPED